MNKVVDSAQQALADIQNGAVVAIVRRAGRYSPKTIR